MANETNDMIEGIYQGNSDKGYGIGGINGMHHMDALGWDNTTVGMASSVFDNLLSIALSLLFACNIFHKFHQNQDNINLVALFFALLCIFFYILVH